MANQTQSFCTDLIWDLEVTWYTDNPDFTTCFQQTVLVYVPFVILLILYPFSLWYTYKSPDRNVPWTVVNRLKMALNVALIILPIIDLGYEVGNR